MANLDEQRAIARRNAEEVLMRKQRKATEHVTDRERDRRALDEKIAHLRGLRLAKEAADKSAKTAAARAPRKKAAKPDE